ncbi:MAG: hypothetical protein E4H28_05425, partial [Gemmatimonadales bacterium]
MIPEEEPKCNGRLSPNRVVGDLVRAGLRTPLRQLPSDHIAARVSPRMLRAMNSATRRAAAMRIGWRVALILFGLVLPGSAPRAEAQDVQIVSSELQAAVQALRPGATLPVVIEFESFEAPSHAVPELISRASRALLVLDAVGPADNDLRVRERFWVVPAATADVTAAGLARLAATAGVKRIVSDELLPVILDPVGQSFAAPAFTSDAMRTIGADAAWDAGITGSGMTVAFFDSGVDGDNAMISRRWRGRSTAVRSSWFDPFRRASLPQDLIGHGTQVALAAVGALSAGDTLEMADGSTIVATSNTDVVTGTAPEAEWIAARVFDNFGSGVFSRRSVLLQAFQWAMDPDGNPATDDAPDVINNSWGILPVSGFDLCTDIVYDAIDVAEAAGIAVLFSSGNTGPASGSVAFPAARDDANLRNFAVGATTGTTTIAVADFSGRGPSPCGGGIKPEIVAPGRVPQVVYAGPGRARLTGLTVEGTSFSVAEASGAVALIRQVQGSIGPEQAKRFLTDNAVDVGLPGPDDDSGFGLLDVPA